MGEREARTRVTAAKVLIEMRHVSALKALAAMALETPLPDEDPMLRRSPFVTWKALCANNRPELVSPFGHWRFE
jgi:hypothetical protein